MFIIYNATGNNIVLAIAGTHSIAEFPVFNNATYSSFNFSIDDIDVISNPGHYIIDAGNIIRPKVVLQISASPTTISADGSTASALTVDVIDFNGNMAQYPWIPMPIPTTSFIYDAYFSDDQSGIVVGAGGYIAKTANAGSAWTTPASGVATDLYGVSFVGASGWAVGASGVILVSADSGATWTPQSSGTTDSLDSVFFYDSSHGWIVGGTGAILYTSDGGITWTPQTSGTSEELNDVVFESLSIGYAVGGAGTILYTSNAGATWVAQTSGIANTLTSISELAASTYMVGGYSNALLTTSNGGAAWSPVSGSFGNVTRVSFGSSTIGWVYSDSPQGIMFTNDGGVTFSAQTIPSFVYGAGGVFAPKTLNGKAAFIFGNGGGFAAARLTEIEVLFSAPPLLTNTTVVSTQGTALNSFSTAITTDTASIYVSANRIYDVITTIYITKPVCVGGYATVTLTQTGDMILVSSSDIVRPIDDAAMDLGTASNRFKDLYLSDGFYIYDTNTHTMRHVVMTSGAFVIS